MDINEIEPNSHKYHMEQAVKANTEAVVAEETPSEDKKVVKGNVRTKKRSLFKRFGDIFFSEDVGDVKTYIIQDIVIPTVKENIVDIITAAAGMIFLGEATRRRSIRPSVGAITGSRFNYNAISQAPKKDKLSTVNRSRSTRDFEEVTFDTRAEAELVLDLMLEAISNYDQVTLLDFYEWAGITTSPTDMKYGWTDLHTARVSGSPSRGYTIDLPACRVLG